MVQAGTNRDWGDFGRHVGMWTRAQQAQLRLATVAIGGIGGIGSAATLMLAKAGVGRLRIADRGVYRAENIVEQAFATWDTTGQRKTSTAGAEARRHQKGLHVDCLHGDLAEQERADRLAHGADVLLSGVDNPRARIALGRAASRAGIPMVVSANVGWTVFHTVYLPANGGYANAWSYLDDMHRDSDGYPDLEDDRTRERVERDWLIWVAILGGYRDEVLRELLDQERGYYWYSAPPAFHAAALGANDSIKLLLGLCGVTAFPDIWVFDTRRNRPIDCHECARRHQAAVEAWERGAGAFRKEIRRYQRG